MAAWFSEDIIFSRKFKVQLGLRADYFTFDVLDQLDTPDFPGNGLPHASGYAQSGIVSPKLNLVWSPVNTLDIYLNGGTGFHSNDSRDVIINTRINEIIRAGQRAGLTPAEIEQQLQNGNFDPTHADLETLPRASGAEIGSRLTVGGRLIISAAAWYLHMQDELVYVGDAGTTEPSGETRRIGIDLEARVQFADWVWADVDLNLADGRYVDLPDNANYIPLAPRITSQGGINFRHSSGLDGALRYRYMADRPANEDNSVTALGFTLGNIVVGYRFDRVRLFAQFENLFNVEWNEAQFDTESRLFFEPSSVSELHYTPGNPFNVQAGISVEF
jgi:outer membrane receptor protein involved in Fe transport